MDRNSLSVHGQGDNQSHFDDELQKNVMNVLREAYSTTNADYYINLGEMIEEDSRPRISTFLGYTDV